MIEAFRWVVGRSVAGSARPGLLRDLGEDLDWLARAGIRHVVTLTEDPLEAGEHSDLRFHHFPIPDMGIPSPRAAARMCAFVLDAARAGEPVLLHCKAGKGRTGTMLAGCLVLAGTPAAGAIERLRLIYRHYLETPAQESFVHHLEQFLAAEASDAARLDPTG